MKTTLLCLALLLISVILQGQPINNYCEGAIILDEEFIADENCIDLGWRSIDVSLDGANPQLNLGQCELQGMPSVWYEIPASNSDYLLSFKLSSSLDAEPSIQVFTGTCSDLVWIGICSTSYRGPLFVMDIMVSPGETYYVLMGDAAGFSDSLRFSWSKRTPGTPCLYEDDFRPVYRSGNQPISGPYLPGDTIGFEYEATFLVNTGDQNCQWMQGVVPVFGKSWDSGSFSAAGQPINATMNGQNFPADNVTNAGRWNWWTNVRYHWPHCYMNVADTDGDGILDMCDGRMDPDCTGPGLAGGCCGPCWGSTNPDSSGVGDLLPPGWFSSGVDGSCGGEQGWPTVDWGDGNTCSGLTGPWVFYFELIVPESVIPNQDEEEDFSIVIHTFADGETGSWTGGPSVCSADYPQRYDPPVIVNCDTSAGRAFLAGKLFADMNDDCAYNDSDAGLNHRIIKIRSVGTGETRLIMTQTEGSFETVVDTGDYWIVPVLEGVEPENCPDSLLIEMSEPCELYTLNFPVDNDLLCIEVNEFFLTSNAYRICDVSNMYVSITNGGNLELNNPTVLLELDSLLILESSSIDYDVLGNNMFLLHAPSLPAGASSYIRLIVKTDCDAPVGFEHCSRATLTNQLCGLMELSDEFCMPNGTAIDPNFKVDASDFKFEVTEIMDASEISYQVHFQNTGTTYARRVTIRDTLPRELDASSFRFRGSSHPVQIALLQDSILQFFFDEINLPDSTTDEPSSHGMIEFELKPIDELKVGDRIRNDASIYFDFSAPVITNLKQHEVVCIPDPGAVVSIQQTLCPDASLVIHGEVFDIYHPVGQVIVQNTLPNGCDSVINVALEFYPQIVLDSVSVESDQGAGSGAIELFVSAGTSYTYLWSNGATTTRINKLNAGTYSVTITDVNGCTETFEFEVTLGTATSDVEKSQLSLRPNPASDVIHLVCVNDCQGAKITIYGLDGRIWHSEDIPFISEHVIAIGLLPRGIYVMEVRSENDVTMLRFMRS